MRAYTKLRVGDSVSFEDDIPSVNDADKMDFAAPANETEPETIQFDNNNNQEEEIF